MPQLMTPIMKELLLNTEAIAINQDYQATPGDVEPACNAAGAVGVDEVWVDEVWVRRLTDGDFAIAMTNWSPFARKMRFCLDALRWPHGNWAFARDVWSKKDLGRFTGQFSATVEGHDTKLLRICDRPMCLGKQVRPV